MEKSGKAIIGTSGYHYKHWLGKFYPQDLRYQDMLNYYLLHFQTVELNNSFYMLPSAEKFENWKRSVPEDFIFAVKASRYITHIKKLNDCQEPLDRLLNNVSYLNEKLGPILFQLPPGWKINIDRLEGFLKLLPSDLRFTLEFRNHTWYTDETYDLLKRHNVSFCIYELEYHQSPMISTADFIYIRLHGPETKYAGDYDCNTLELWKERIIQWNQEGKDVYCYFDNDQNAYAAYNALTLQDMLVGAVITC
ncbi:MAG: DUF72 domain-containing protein [Cytophagaceae bacterium]